MKQNMKTIAFAAVAGLAAIAIVAVAQSGQFGKKSDNIASVENKPAVSQDLEQGTGDLDTETPVDVEPTPLPEGEAGAKTPTEPTEGGTKTPSTSGNALKQDGQGQGGPGRPGGQGRPQGRPEGGRPEGGRDGGQMMGRMMRLGVLGIPEVQKHIGVTEAQLKKIEEWEPTRPNMPEGQQPDPQQFMEMQRKVQAERDSFLKSTLGNAKFERMQQLELQLAGASAMMRPDIAEKIGITEAQQQKMVQAAMSAMEAFRPKEGEQPAMPTPEQMQAASKKLNDAILGQLSATQKQKWDAMLGEPFDFPAEVQNMGMGMRRGGGPGGMGGPGGGRRGGGGPGGPGGGGQGR